MISALLLALLSLGSARCCRGFDQLTPHGQLPLNNPQIVADVIQHKVILSWFPDFNNPANTITRVWRTNYSNGTCHAWHLKYGTRKDTWTDTTVLASTSYCYRLTAYDKDNGKESVPTDYIIVDVP